MFHAARVGGDPAVGGLHEAGVGQQLVRAGPDHGGREFEEPSGQGQQFAAGQESVGVGILGKIPDPVPGNGPGDRLAEKGRSSPCRGLKAEQDLDGCGLARPIGPQEPIDGSRRHAKCQILQGLDRPPSRGE